MRQENVDAHGREVARVLQRGVRRVRLQRACVAAVFAAAAALVISALLRSGPGVPPRVQHGGSLGLLVALPLLASVACACLRVDRARVARLLDRTHGLHDTLQAALEVACLPAARRSMFGAALLRQADALAPGLSPRRAVPLHVPRAAQVTGALALLLFSALLLWPLGATPKPEPAPRPGNDARQQPKSARAEARDADELRAEQRGADPRQRELARALAAGEISHAEAIGKLLALERELRHADGEELLRGELLERLNELIESKGKSPRKLESAAEVLRDAASTPQQREEQRRLIEEKRRELEKLRAEHAKSAAERRALDKLSRQLGDAAKALAAGRPEQAASQLQTATEQVRKQAQAQRRRQQQKEGAEAAAQLRERLQRQRAARGRADAAPGRAQAGRDPGQQRQEQEQRFVQRAEGGEQLAPSPAGGSGDPAESSPEPSLLGREPRPRVSLEDHAAQSAQSEGPSRSEVVLSAADRGFADEGYRKVYADYRDHAEAVLEQDQVPSGYRYYVRRYFQLIRPRTGARR
jgi:hypothetical protein